MPLPECRHMWFRLFIVHFFLIFFLCEIFYDMLKTFNLTILLTQLLSEYVYFFVHN